MARCGMVEASVLWTRVRRVFQSAGRARPETEAARRRAFLGSLFAHVEQEDLLTVSSAFALGNAVPRAPNAVQCGAAPPRNAENDAADEAVQRRTVDQLRSVLLDPARPLSDPAVHVARSPLGGWGLFARRPLAPGLVVALYPGRVTPPHETRSSWSLAANAAGRILSQALAGGGGGGGDGGDGLSGSLSDGSRGESGVVGRGNLSGGGGGRGGDEGGPLALDENGDNSYVMWAANGACYDPLGCSEALWTIGEGDGSRRGGANNSGGDGSSGGVDGGSSLGSGDLELMGGEGAEGGERDTTTRRTPRTTVAYRRRNHLAVGHRVNHPPRGELPSVLPWPCELGEEDAAALSAAVPNEWSSVGRSAVPVGSLLALVTIRPVEKGEELFLDYRYEHGLSVAEIDAATEEGGGEGGLGGESALPPWYSPVPNTTGRPEWTEEDTK